MTDNDTPNSKNQSDCSNVHCDINVTNSPIVNTAIQENKPVITSELFAFYNALGMQVKVAVWNGITCPACISPKRLEAESEYLRNRSVQQFADTVGVSYAKAYGHLQHSGMTAYGKSRLGLITIAERFVRSGLLADAKASDGVKALELIARLEGHLKTDTQESTETILDAIRAQTTSKQGGKVVIEDAEYTVTADDLAVEDDRKEDS